MKLLLTATALLGLGISAAQPADSGWPQSTCLHGTTINESNRPLNLRSLEGQIRLLLHEAGVTPAPSCSTYLNILVHAEALGAQSTRITAHLIAADREVSLNEVGRSAKAFKCGRTVTDTVRQDEDFLVSAQAVLTRLLSEPPSCHR